MDQEAVLCNIAVIREYHERYHCSESARETLNKIEALVPTMNKEELSDAFRQSIQLVIDLQMLEVSHLARLENARRGE